MSMRSDRKTGNRRSVLCAAMWAVIMTALFPPLAALGRESVLSSPHNLSASGSGQHFATETRVCVFCHVPHNASNPEQLWSRELPPAASYTPYDSTTLQADPKPDLPTGASRLCLSCHDGTIALGHFVGSRVSATDVIAEGSDLTSDLSDDHPISFLYSEDLVIAGELVSPAALPAAIKLDAGGMLQCTACHEPHNNEFGNFLVLDNSVSGSPLCTACHVKSGWPDSGHNPQQSPTLTAGCMNCHYAHSAPEPRRLLHSQYEEENCTLNCHNGLDATSVDVQTVLASSISSHPVAMNNRVHDPLEELPADIPHVECVDCHNPHQAGAALTPLASPPAINATLQGVRMDSFGGIATTEFDICFKCHAGSNAGLFRGISVPNRLYPDADQRNRFEPTNASFHPVMANRRGNTNGASLLPTLKIDMVRIYCIDCHNSDKSTRALNGGTGADGPHGSGYEHILIAEYEMPPPMVTLPYATERYDLCFRCHDEGYLMVSGSAFVNGSLNLHDEHVRLRDIPCFACHDPHGTSRVAGADENNSAHLINFDRDYTVSAAVPLPEYETLAPASGSCTVSCHSNPTVPRTYSP